MGVRTTSVSTRITAFVVSLLAAVGLMVALAPSAQAADSYPVYVSGEQVTSENASDVLGDGGSVAYDYETNTLTLTNASVDVVADVAPSFFVGEQPTSVGIFEGTGPQFVIELVGDNKIVYEPSDEIQDGHAVYGIFSAGTSLEEAEDWSARSFAPAEEDPWLTPDVFDLRITGDGTLSIEIAPGVDSATPSEAAGINMDGDCIAFIDGDTSIELGSARGPAAYNVKGFHGMILNVTDAAFDVYCGPGLGISGVYCMATYAMGSAKVGIDISSGAIEAFGIDGGLEAMDDAEVYAWAGIAMMESIGIYGEYVGAEGNAKVTAISAGASGFGPVPVGPTPVNPGEFGGFSAGINCYEMYVADNSTLVATGKNQGVMAESGIDIDDHDVGGAIVSYENSPAPTQTMVWDSSQDDPLESYRYVRIPGTPLVTRIAGDYANETAAQIAKNTYFESECVVLARDDDFADALGATGLAGTLKCPIVLTDRMALSDAAAKEIANLHPETVYVIGGTGAIKEQVDADLAALGVSKVERVWGENSYDTSLECAKKIVELGGDSGNAVVAMSTNFQDALSFSPIAYWYKLPVILQTWGDTSADRGFTDEAAAWLAGKKLTVVGGPGAISEESLEGYHVYNRIYGETGYDTSNEIAKWATQEDYLDPSSVVIACGAQAPKGVDALAGAALAGKLGCPVLLVSGNDAMEEINTVTIDGYLTDNASRVLDVYVLGGGYVIPQDVVDKIEALFAPEP